MVVMGHEHAEMLGIKHSEYLPAAMHIHVADSRSKGAAGMAILELSAKSLDGTVHTTWQQAYIMDGAEHLYLSYEALRELESLSESLPKAKGNQEGRVSGVKKDREGQEPRRCNCPDRTLPPPAPMELPFEADERNIDKLREWIMDMYIASAFNTCTHQTLPMVDSTPPLKLHVDPKVKPVVYHKPGNVPLHCWSFENVILFVSFSRPPTFGCKDNLCGQCVCVQGDGGTADCDNAGKFINSEKS